ncbi:MAG TPA: Sir2 family NAD-dependent protein deacetylase [Kineosporiaceae bacterium]|nr:Sir2 family NAD-dependent protein deacetylase [Kineosporiaceae bacterium]
MPADVELQTAVAGDDDATIAEVSSWIRDASAVTVLTGAGISTESGIPDFRGPQGLWTRDPGLRQMSDLQAYLADPLLRARVWRNRREHAAWSAEPNEGHRALVDLERAGRLLALVTQNIDGLHQRAGNCQQRVIELHGTLREVECLSCRRRRPTAEILDRVDAGEADPPCTACGGILKTAAVSFGQALDPAVLAAARDAVVEADLFVAAGTSLTVQPAASLAGLAADHGTRLVILNAEPTPYDELAGAVLRRPLVRLLPLLFLGLRP